MKRVVVTGIGAATPLGNSFENSWENAKAGSSGIGDITRFHATRIKWKVAGELKRFPASLYLSPKEIVRLDPFIHYAVAASLMAAEDAKLVQKSEVSLHRRLVFLGESSGVRTKARSQRSEKDFGLITADYLNCLTAGGVIIGSSRGGISTIEQSSIRAQSIATSDDLSRHEHRIQNFSPKLSPYIMPSTSVSAAASYVAMKMGIKGYCLGISNSCASGANAIGEAYKLIRSGYAGPVLAGGSEAPICRLCVEGFGVSGALSRINNSSASRPFDITRDGFVIAEGACILVLEDYKAALKRGARIYGEIIGYGNTIDAFHQTRPDPEGEARAIRMAINEAGLAPEDVDYINAHAPSTPLGDKAETKALKLVFSKRAYDIPVSSIKSMSGHMLAASGAFEVAVTLMSIYKGLITPTINLKMRDPECDLSYVTETKKTDIKTAISNSFGFGGVNAVLVFRKVEAFLW